MGQIWRVLDTGLRPAAQNIALDRALLEARKADEIPSTLRFLRFTRSALLGSRQSAAQEIDLDYCQGHRVEVQRRLTSGPSQFVDEAQLGWTLCLHKREAKNADARTISKRVCHAVATAIGATGLDARYRARDEIEVDGRMVGSCGIAFDGDALLLQGMLFVDFAVDEMLHVLRVPFGQSMGKTRAAASERVAGLKRCLGKQPDLRTIKHYIVEAFESDFDVEFREADLTLSEDARYHAALREIDTPDWVNLFARAASEAPIIYAVCHVPGGQLQACVMYDVPAQTIKQVWFSGDIVIDPGRTISDLEAELRDVPVERLARKIEGFFSSRRVTMRALVPSDFVNVVRQALQQPLLIQNP
jgi:lipoate-protein ligase A